MFPPPIIRPFPLPCALFAAVGFRPAFFFIIGSLSVPLLVSSAGSNQLVGRGASVGQDEQVVQLQALLQPGHCVR